MPQDISNGPQACFEKFLCAGRFMLQRSRSTGKYIFYPRVLVPGSGEADLEWVEASGRGVVYAITLNRTRTGNYNIALVDLEEGPRMMATIVGCDGDGSAAVIGAPVMAAIEQQEAGARIVFSLVDKGEAA